MGRYRNTLIDTALVGAILLMAPYGSDGGAGFTVVMALALIPVRRWPIEVFFVLAALASVHWALDVAALGDAALLVAFYMVAANESTRRTVVAAVVLLAGIVAAMISQGGGTDETLRAILTLAAMGAAAGTLGINAKNRRALVESLEERAARLEVERDQQAQLAAADERARIAREMHDVVAHNLSVMIALSDGALYQLDQDPGEARDAMETASRTGRQALGEMRRLLGVLRDGDASDGDPAERAPQPGAEDIAVLVDRVREAGMPVSLERDGADPSALPGGMQLAAYRIVQEALTNTLKHAGPGARAHVRLHAERDALEVEVHDRGGAVAGRDSSRRAPSVGGGLRGMRERAAIYDGTLTAGPTPDGGWRVRAELHVPAPAT